MQSRGICTCASRLSSMQLGRFMNKVMSKDKPKKSRRKESVCSTYIAPAQPFFGPKMEKTTHKNHRVTILNKIFMNHITDLMATGEVASQLVGKGIEISHVKVAPDYRLITVYWFAQNDSDANESIEKILRKAAGHLQHELSQLRVIGMVPPINFVRNKAHSAVKEVESRLSQVDFGEDFVPSSFIQTQIKTPLLQMSLSPEIKAKLSKLESNHDEREEDEEEIYEIKIPEMKQNVMGFNHAAIKLKIKACLNKAKLAEQRRILDIPEEPQGFQASSDDVATFLDNKEQKALFDDFIKKRLIEEKRRLRVRSQLDSRLEEEQWVEDRYDDRDELDIDEDEFFKDDVDKENG